jgi:hypothetical protein
VSSPQTALYPDKNRVASLPGYSPAQIQAEVEEPLRGVAHWIEVRDFAGFDLYDILNSPYLSGWVARRFPLNIVCVQMGKRWAGSRSRRLLRVPASKNPKALALCLAAYCDLSLSGEESHDKAQYLKSELIRLRSPGEAQFCWGYDWDYVSLRGTQLKAFGPNCIATYFCASALLDVHEAFGDAEALAMAQSAGEFIVSRLNRTIDTPEHLCFSYTPEDHTKIFNNSVLAGSLLARLAERANESYLPMAKRTLQYLADRQQPDGSWAYGERRIQKWVDSFHTGYNLLALLHYRNATDDMAFDGVLRRGYDFYRNSFWGPDGMPKYTPHSAYPVDIHSSAQAILTFCAFADSDPTALSHAFRILQWTNRHLRNADGSYAFQKHRLWTNRTPYMRWGQAWMFRALARFRRKLNGELAMPFAGNRLPGN